MASTRETLELILSAKDEGGPAFKSFASGIDNISARINAVAGPIADLSKNFLMLSGGVAAAGAAMLGLAIKESATLESAMADLAKVFSGTDEELKKLQEGAENLSVKYGQSITSIVDGMAKFAGAGANMVEILDLQTQSMNAAEAGNMGVAEASQFLLQVLSGLGMKFEEVGRVVDSVNTIENNFNVRQREMYLALTESSGAARNIGVNLEELEAVLVPIIEVMGSGSEAGTAMRVVLTKMFEDIGTGKNEFEKLGLALTDANGKFRPFLDILQDLVPMWKKLTDVQKQNLLGAQIGVRGIQGFSFVMNDFNKVLKANELAHNSAGSAMVEVEKKLATTISKWEQMKKSVSDLQRTIGSEFLPGTKGLIDVIKETVLAVDAWEKKNHVIATTLKDFLTPIIDDVVTSLKVLAENAPEIFAKLDLTPLQNAFQGLLQAITGVSSVDLSTVSGWTALFQSLSDTVAGAINVLSAMIEVGKGVGQAIFKLVEIFNSLPPSVQAVVGVVGALSIVVTAIGTPLALFASSLATLIPLIPGISAVLGGLVAALTGPVGLAVALAAIATAITVHLAGLDNIKAAWNAVVNFIYDKVVGAFNYVYGLLEKIGSLAAKAGSILYSLLPGSPPPLSLGITKALEDVGALTNDLKNISKIAPAIDLSGIRTTDTKIGAPTDSQLRQDKLLQKSIEQNLNIQTDKQKRTAPIIVKTEGTKQRWLKGLTDELLTEVLRKANSEGLELLAGI